MHSVFPERFKSARKKNGLSLQELSEKMDKKVSKQALHKYDTGEVIPNSQMIDLLSKALNVTPDYFFQEVTFELHNVEFRKLDISVKEENRIIEEVKDQLYRYFEIENILGIQTNFINPLQDFRIINSQDDIDEAAEFARKEWKLGCDPISNCVELLECNHIKIVEIEVEKLFDGMHAMVNGTIPIIAINKTAYKSPDRLRFTIIHEFAHATLKFNENISHKQKEIYCNKFAAAFLMPKTEIFKILGENRTKLMVQELGEVKKQFGISIQAIVMRSRDLGIINQRYCSNFFTYFTELGFREEEPFPYEGKEHSHRFNQLLFRALGEEIITVSKAATLKNLPFIEFKEKFLKY